MRPASLAAVGLALAGLVPTAGPATAEPAGGGPPSAGRSPLAVHEHQRLDWGRCSPEQRKLNEAGARCAKVTVPLDYSDPGGRTIKIAVSRIRASSPHGRRGILLSNPGGPGGTGLANTLALRPSLKDVAGRYDLIGFDPRFLGESTPIS
ncbi:alpha/beta hydrolase, partial [Streptomyces sp. SB3404]|nr:alpha/beta hydrolase [Streptomyces boncukensis]